MPVLTAYKDIISQAEPDDAKKLGNKILSLLSEGRNTTNDAIGQLEKSGFSFNNASGSLLVLNTTLHNDFKTGSATEVSEIRFKFYSILVALLAGGAVILIIQTIWAKGQNLGEPTKLTYIGLGVLGVCILIIVVFVEFSMVQQVIDGTSDAQTVFDNLKVIVQDAETKIMEAKTVLNKELQAQDSIVVKIEETHTFATDWVDIPEHFLPYLRNSTQTLIDMCEHYKLNVIKHAKLNPIKL